MQAMLSLSSLIDRTTQGIGRAVAWCILLAIGVSAANALVRKVFSTSSNAWLELQWYLFGAAFLLAAADTLRQNGHIRIDIVYARFPRRVQHWIDLFGHLVFLLPFCGLMVAYLVPYVAASIRNGEMSASAGGLLIWPAKALLLAGFLLLTAQGLSEVIKTLAVMRGHLPDKQEGGATAPHGGAGP